CTVPPPPQLPPLSLHDALPIYTADTPSVYDVLIDDLPFEEIVQGSPESPNLFCAPSTIHLAGAEIELVSQVAREFRLRRALETRSEGTRLNSSHVKISYAVFCL